MSSRRSDNIWSVHDKVDNDETFRVAGRVLNDLNEWILDLEKKNSLLEQQVELMEKQQLTTELDELRLRDKHPGLKELWDEYQTMKALCESGKRIG